MHSVLFTIFGFPIHAYGAMLAISFLTGIWFASYRAKKAGLNPNIVADFSFYVILSSIVGARLYYVILHWEEFATDPISIVNPFANGSAGIGGLVMYGGFIGAVAAGFVFFRIKRLPFLPYADICAPSFGIGIFFTRIGCFLNGCCYGAPSLHGVSFPADSPAGAYQVSMHACGLQPSQLYESVGGLLLMSLVLLSERRFKFKGSSFYVIGVGYAVLRFAVDLTRFYSPGERLWTLSHNQILCVGLFVVFGVLWISGLLKKRKASSVSRNVI